MKFYIPSYRRADQQKALRYLEGLGFGPREITIATQTKSDAEEYAAKHGSRARIIYAPGKCIADNRNTILRDISIGDRAMMFDDDIEALCKFIKPDRAHKYGQLVPITDRGEFDAAIDWMFATAERHNAHTFALSVVSNLLMLSGENERGAYHLNAKVPSRVMGIIRDETMFDPRFATKEDYDYTLQQIANGYNVVKFSRITARSKENQPGGCFEAHRDREIETARLLVQKYPMWVKHARKPGEVIVRVK